MQGKSFRLKETADFNEIMKTISENRKRKKTEKTDETKHDGRREKESGAKRTADR